MNIAKLNTAYDGGLILNTGSGGGGNTVSVNDVTFYDYDGTVLYAYTKEDFLKLKELPALPTREGLICQEWNWDYENAVEYVQDYGILDVGATYTTDDGTTRIYIEVSDLLTASVSFVFAIKPELIDWGDGVEDAKTSHTYTKTGNYCITLKSSTKIILGNKNSYSYLLNYTQYKDAFKQIKIKKIHIGDNVDLAGFGINSLPFLSCVTIPYGCSVESKAFLSNTNVRTVIIPKGTVPSSNFCREAQVVERIILPQDFGGLQDAYNFQNNYHLARLVIPPNVTAMAGFTGLYELTRLVIPKNVSTLTNDGLYNCYGLKLVDFSKHTSIPTTGSGFISNKNNSLAYIVVPDALYDEWKASTNWSDIASKIIKKSDWDIMNT